jgi:hypothetical protein
VNPSNLIFVSAYHIQVGKSPVLLRTGFTVSCSLVLSGPHSRQLLPL